MEFKGRIASMFRDLVTGNWNVTFSTNQNIEEALQTFSGKEPSYISVSQTVVYSFVPY